MEKIERFEKALSLVENYESYLFRRAMGIALIICGIIFPLTAFMILKAQTIADLLNISTQAFITFIPSILLLIGTAIIVYNFTSAHVVTSRMRKQSVWKEIPHLVFMFLIWFFAFYLTKYVPEPFTILSWLWAGGGASLLSYLLTKRYPDEDKFTELLIISIICIASSIPIYFIQDEQLVLTAVFLIFSLSFITGGIYSIINASKLLSEGEK